ncbi:autotransporter domain-containing protein [Endozoicomonas lisbonensis]|uniref:Outer membrane autotransporter protein n=1 Tax=Endozoicomonas lisbonensis TaxID=3120522 RepID=A0ABV2SP46_9GAMM
MKQVQVFKKTLLSLAVVSAFGGYGTVTQAKPTTGGGTTVNPSPSTSSTSATSSASSSTPSLNASSIPTQSTVSPSQSTVSPSQSTVSPTQSTATPTQSTATPSQSTATPSQSTATPTQSTATPSQSTATPSQSTATPSQSTATPTQSTVPPTQSTTGQTATGQTATGQTATGQTAAGQTAAGQTAAGQTAAGQTATGQTATGQTTTGQTTTGQTTTGQTTTGQQQPKSFNPITFEQGNDQEIKEHLVLLEDKFNALTGNDFKTKSIRYSSRALFDHLQQADNDVADLNKKLQSAKAASADPKVVADLENKIKKAEEYAKKARQDLVAFAKANQDRLGLKDNFLLAATQSVAGNKPGVVRQEKNAEPAEKVDFAALRRTSEGVTADASKVGLDASPVQAKGEDTAKFQTRVAEARKKLDALSQDDFRKIFLIKDPKAPDPSQAKDVAPEVIRLKGYDLRVPELYNAFMDRVQKDVPELFDSSANAAASADVVFTGGTVELDGFKTSPQSPLPGAHFVTPKGAKAADPYGTYTVAEGSDVYQASIGKDKPVDTFVVENSKFHAEDGVYASKVSIKDTENVAGYAVDAAGNVTEGYLPIVAKSYEDTAVKGKPAANGVTPVIARKRTVASFQGVKNGMVTVKGHEDVSITSSNLKSDGLGVAVTKGGAGTENMTIKDSTINMASGTEIVAQNLVVEGSSKINSTVDVVQQTTQQTAQQSSQQGATQAASSGSSNQAPKTQPQPAKSQQVVGLTTVRGANLKKTFVETTTQNGQQTTKDVEVDAVDTFKIGKGSEVLANIEGYEEGTVAGTLISDHIGSDNSRINKLVLEQGAVLRRYSSDGNTIYGSEKLDVTVGNGMTVIHDVNGFHTIVLDGGLLEGSLTGLNPIAQPAQGQEAFEGSTVEMKSGTYQGGDVTNVKSFTISGPVHLMPGSTKLNKVNADGSVQATETKPINIRGDVPVTSGSVFVISKAPDLAKGQSPVNVNGSVDFKKGSGLAVVVDDFTTSADLNVAYLNIEDGTPDYGAGVLKLEGGNKVHIRPQNLTDEASYDKTKALYEKAKEDPKAFADMTIVNYQSVQGSFEAPVSEYPLLNVASAPEASPLPSPGSYKVRLTFNTDPRNAFRSVWNMNSNDADVASAALLSSLEAGGETGRAMFNAIQKDGYQRAASENQWDPHVGMGMAAVTVTQKANQSISRHLNRHRTGIATGDMFESKGVWGEYFYSDGEMDDKSGVRGFENKVNGINLGLDALLNDQLTVGFAFTYGDVKTETNKSGRDASGDTFMGTLYTGWTMENYFFDTMWSYGRGSIDMKRKTSQGTYKSDTKSDTLGARLVGGYNYQLNQWLIQPQIEFNYVKVKFDDFKEKQQHGVFAQSVKLDDFEVMELGAGLKLMADYDVANGMLKPEFTLMGYHDFKDKKPEVQGTFLNGGRTYHVSGRDREENRVLAGVGLKYEMNNNLSLGLNYDYNWQGDYTAHGIVASVRYDF